MSILYHFLLMCIKTFLILFYRFLPKDREFSNFLRYRIENFLFFAPRKKKIYPLRKELIGTLEPVRFINDECIKLYAWFLKPEERQPIIIFCHGQSESISKWQDVAVFLKKNGYGGFFISYRGHYKSAGYPDEKGIVKDVQSAIYHLKERGYNEKDIILWGRSLGSYPACDVARKNNIKALIMESSFENIITATLSMTYYKLEKCHLLFIFPLIEASLEKTVFIQNFENNKIIADVNVPTLIIHSKKDEKIPYQAAEALHKLNPRTKLVLSEYGSHNTNEWALTDVKLFIENISGKLLWLNERN